MYEALAASVPISAVRRVTVPKVPTSAPMSEDERAVMPKARGSAGTAQVAEAPPATRPISSRNSASTL